MTTRYCPKCGSSKVQVTAKVAESFSQKLEEKKLIYDFKTGFSYEDFPIIEIVNIIKCSSCGEPYNEEKWKIVFVKEKDDKS